MQDDAPKPLVSLLRQRINRLAHHQAREHEGRIKTALVEQLTRAKKAGATYDQLCAELAAAEAAARQGRFL